MWDVDASTAAGSLDEQGWWSCDGCVSEQLASDLRREILEANAAGLLRQSGNVLAVRTADGGRKGVAQAKPHVYEADVIARGAVERADVLQRCPTLERLLGSEGDLRRLLNDARPQLCLDRLEQAKIQVNTGDLGAFPHHFDVPSEKGARRLLTALVYLNPEWKEGDGGEVELLPFPFADVAVQPLDRRLVVFSSNTTMHRVRPFRGSGGRVCINMWFDGDTAPPLPAPLPPDEYDSRAVKIVRILRSSPTELRAFCKVWYRDAIAQSFRDAFRPSPELDDAIKLHYEEATEIESRIAQATMDALRACLPLAPRVESADLGGLFDGM